MNRSAPKWSTLLLVLLLALWSAPLGCSGTALENQSEGNQGDGQEGGDDEEEEGPAAQRFETIFTEPEVGSPDDAIGAALIALLEQTPEGAQVRGAFFSFSREAVAQAFVDAYERGVDVKVVVGNTNQNSSGGDWSAVAVLREGLGDALTVCRDGQSSGACIGTNINHNKFVVFSELEDGSENVVFQSSGNITNFQLLQYDNVLVVYGDRSLYRGFRQYWSDLRRQELKPDYNGYVAGDAEVEAYFSPYSAGDPVHEDLLKVDCTQGGEVYLAMAFFTNYRAAIAERLREMDQEGCVVGVLLRSSEINSPGTQIGNNLIQGTIDVGYFSSSVEIQLHSKYLIYRGVLRGESEPSHVVWTGSHNYTRSALYENDEVLLRAQDEEVFEAYRANWVWMRERAATLHP